MKTRHHACWDKAGLLIDVVRKWPVDWVTDDDGKPFQHLSDAVRAIMDVPTPFVPMGCPEPGPDGRCPGHPQ